MRDERCAEPPAAVGMRDERCAEPRLQAKDLISLLLAKTPGDRISASEALKHEWIKMSSDLHAGSEARLLRWAAHPSLIHHIQ